MRTIQGYIGEPLAELLKQNGEHMDLERRFDNSPLIFPDNDLSGDVFHFVYNQPGGEVDLPTARLIWFNQYAGVITEVTVNTSDQKNSLPDLFRQLHELRGKLIQAGWEEVQPLVSYVDLQAIIDRSEGTSNQIGAGKYKKGSAEALIMLNTPGGVVTPGKAAEAAFIAEVWFHDEALAKQQSDKAYGARKKVKGNDGIALPLSYWVK